MPEAAAARHAAAPADVAARPAQHVAQPPGAERRPAVLCVWRTPAPSPSRSQSKRERILLRGVRDLVDETLHDERVRGVRGRAPGAARDAGVDGEPFHPDVRSELRRKVVRVELGRPQLFGLHVRAAVVLRGAREAMRPAGDCSSRVERGDQMMMAERPEEVVAHVLFARPDAA